MSKTRNDIARKNARRLVALLNLQRRIEKLGDRATQKQYAEEAILRSRIGI